MNADQQRSLYEDAVATLERLKRKHEDLGEALDQAYGYAVFPSLGRASLVLGATFGRGAVFEKGKSVGFASLTQITVGVQVGGQTLSELVFFEDQEAFELFKGGKAAFAANVSAGILKAAATGTTNPSPFTAHAYSRGGMVIEASLGGQKLSFIPPLSAEEEAEAAKGGDSEKRGRDEKSGRDEMPWSDEKREGGPLQSMKKSPFVAAGISALALMATRALKARAEARSEGSG